MLANELFGRSHYSEVEAARNEGQTNQVLKSSYSDRVMKEIMGEIMEEYDTDHNKQVDFEEFKEIVSDSDVDMLLSVY